MNIGDFFMPHSEHEYLSAIDAYNAHLHQAVAKSILGIGKLPQRVLELEGMSSYGNRLILNNLCAVKGRYLEIGSWKGSTFISALYKNPLCHGISIDHHQEFKGHMFESSTEILKANCEANLTSGESYELINGDCFELPIPEPNSIDIYLYDGWHSYEAQHKALTYYYDCLKPFFYFICDDYSIDRVERGTQDALKELDIQVISDFKLYGNQMLPRSTKEGFWNGYYIAFCVKKRDLPQFFKKEKYTHCFDSN